MVIGVDWLSIVRYIFIGLGSLMILRILLSYKSILYGLVQCWDRLGEKMQAYQYLEIAQFNDNGVENPLYRKVAIYLSSLPSLEDAHNVSLVSSSSSLSPCDFYLPVQLGPTQMAHDSFQGARLSWTLQSQAGPPRLVLRVKREDKSRVLRPYVQYVESIFDDPEIRHRNLRLFTNYSYGSESRTEQSWKWMPFTHPATIDSLAMDPEIKNLIRNDLETFLNGRDHYRSLSRVWKRSYLLHGSTGTGKSCFSAAMTRFLGYDVYDFDLTGMSREGLRCLLAKTTPKSVILIEDLNRHLNEGNVHLPEILNFMDGIFSCCGHERIMIFTMTTEDKEGYIEIDRAFLRPGRLDVHIHFPMCDFVVFKTLAENYLGIKDHKLYPQVEEEFRAGARMSPAEVGEIMISSYGSSTRAMKRVISVLKARNEVLITREEERIVGESGRLTIGKSSPVSEFKKLYGLIKVRSRRDGINLDAQDASMAVTPVSARHSMMEGRNG